MITTSSAAVTSALTPKMMSLVFFTCLRRTEIGRTAGRSEGGDFLAAGENEGAGENPSGDCGGLTGSLGGS
ncbi:MAG: hypothetical protein WC889_14160, partial [Myxococcota bacterium]